eukprot:gene59618-79539_t
MTDHRPKPRAFRLDDPKVVVAEDGFEPSAALPSSIIVTPIPDTAVENTLPIAPERKRRSRWGALFWTTLGGLVSLAIGLSVTRLIEDLFARSDWLGWLAAALTALAALAILVIALREIVGLMRLSRIEAMHDRARAIVAADDRTGARTLVGDLLAIYARDARTARARSVVEDAARDIVDGADLVRIAERALMEPLDQEASRIIAD